MDKTLQQRYRTNVIIAFGVSICMIAYLFVSLLVTTQIDNKYVFIVYAVVLLLFLPLNSKVRHENKKYSLKFPELINRKVLSTLPSISILVWIIVLISGAILYPTAPIKEQGNLYTDKAGMEHSFAEFRNFQKWELTLITVWGIGLLEAIVFMPFYDKKSNKWRF